MVSRSGFACSVLVILALVAPTLVHAQFQQPTPEELKMTDDPKSPGAAAVYLSFEEDDNDPLHYQGIYARIKVLQEKGKELATIQLPYLRGNTKITNIAGRTIHADGTVIPLEGKPEDLMVSKSGDRQFGRKVFTLPSVEVGSILEYHYQVRYDDNTYSSPYWEIQRPYFIHKAHYTFTPYKQFMPGVQNATGIPLLDGRGNVIHSLIWWPKLPEGVKVNVDVRGHYSLDMTDIPPIPDEAYMPPLYSFLYKVLFYYKSSFDPKDFWVSEGKRWSQEVDHFAEPSKALREAVSGLVSPGDSEPDKARKLYTAVQALDNTDFSRAKGASELKQLNLKAARRAEDTWTQKSGSSEDIALLYLAMLRSAGLTAYAMKVVDRERAVFDGSYLEIGQFDNTLVILSTGGKEIYLDPGEKMCPFQTLHWRHSGSGGIRQSPDGRGVANSPLQVYSANSTSRFGDLTIDEHGGVSGGIRLVMDGQEALRWRQTALENDETEVKKQFDQWLESIVPDGVEAHVDHFLALTEPDANLMAIVKVEGTLGTVTSKRILLPGFFFETRGSRPFVNQQKRQEFVDMHYGEQVTDQVVYHLPSGLAMEGAPEDANIPWTGRAGFKTKTTVEPGQVTVARTLSRAFTFLKPDDYLNLRDFYQKIAATDKEQLVLTVAPAAKGGQ
jgi:hypothetical protein